jgi:hypothetical protein
MLVPPAPLRPPPGSSVKGARRHAESGGSGQRPAARARMQRCKKREGTILHAPATYGVHPVASRSTASFRRDARRLCKDDQEMRPKSLVLWRGTPQPTK